MIPAIPVYRVTLLSLADGALVGFGASLIAAPIVYRILLFLKSRQTISEHLPAHQAKQGTPTMGGLIVLPGIIAGWLYFRQVETDVIPFLVLVLGFAAIGFVDDYLIPRVTPGARGLEWIPKLCLQFAVALPAAWLSGADQFWPCVAFGFLVVAVSNAFNFADGMDGLAGGLAVILALTLAILGVCWESSAKVVGLSTAIAGSLLPFLYLNAPPARVFMGDVGSLPLGAGLAWLAIQVPQETRSWGAAIPLGVLGLVLAAELIPVPLQILSVKLRKKRLFRMTPIHHAFEACGWPETRVVGLFLVTQAALAAVALSLAAGSWGGLLGIPR